jgi:hypothetical protein
LFTGEPTNIQFIASSNKNEIGPNFGGCRDQNDSIDERDDVHELLQFELRQQPSFINRPQSAVVHSKYRPSSANLNNNRYDRKGSQGFARLSRDQT